MKTTQQDELRAYFTDQPALYKRLVTEVPSFRPNRIKKLPPSTLKIDALIITGIARGEQPWWIIIVSWTILLFLYGVTFFITRESARSPDFIIRDLLSVALQGLTLWVLYKGTLRKLSQQAKRAKRRAKYKQRSAPL